MSEENKNNEMDPKPHQLAMAQSMGLKPEVIKFLDKVQGWREREWYYLCALDQIPLSLMIDMANEKCSVDPIRKERIDYLKKMYTDLEPIGRELDTLKKEVQEVLGESKSTRELIAQNIDVALRKQAEAQEETIQSKNAQIKMMEKKLSELSQMIDKKEHKEESLYVPSALQTEVKKKRWLSQLIHGSDSNRFINQYIKSERMSEEQKNFLLECLEEGMAMKDIEKFASPDLPVSIMKRIKNLYNGK